MSRLFGRHTGRRCRRRWASHGSSTGWSGLAQLVPAPREEMFSRPRTPLALCPVSEDVVPFAEPSRGYTRPYNSTKGDAA